MQVIVDTIDAHCQWGTAEITSTSHQSRENKLRSTTFGKRNVLLTSFTSSNLKILKTCFHSKVSNVAR